MSDDPELRIGPMTEDERIAHGREQVAQLRAALEQARRPDPAPPVPLLSEPDTGEEQP